MGREVKRVAIDFDWPLNKVWNGYINPHYVKCPQCDGTGVTSAHRRLDDLVGMLMLSGEDSLRGRNHPYFNGSGFYSDAVPSPDMAELTTGLAGRAPYVMGHDSIDRWNATGKIIAAAGMPENWGNCLECGASGIHKDHESEYNAWKEEEPPAGDGWQMWETTSEGSPISPVFKTKEELAHWLEDTKASAFGEMTATYQQWLRMIDQGSCISAYSSSETGIVSGVEACSAEKNGEE